MRESHSCTSSFLPQDEIDVPERSLIRRSSGSEMVEQRRATNVYRKPHPVRRVSEVSPQHATQYLDNNCRIRLVGEDRSVSTGALMPQSDRRASSSRASTRGYTDDGMSDHQMDYERTLGRHEHYQTQSPDFYHSATSSTGSTPPFSPLDQIRPNSASGYRRRFLPATPTRPSRVVSMRHQDTGSGISASASAVSPLSRLHTSSPLSHVRSSSYASNNSMWRGTTESTFVPKHVRHHSGGHNNDQIQLDYFDSAFDENIDYAASRPLISPPVARKLPETSSRRRLNNRSQSIVRRNTAPGRERPQVEIRHNFEDDEEISLAHENTDYCDFPSQRNSGTDRRDTLHNSEEEFGRAHKRSASLRCPTGRCTFPDNQQTRLPWKSLSIGRNISAADGVTVISNPTAGRFQTSNDDEVDAIFRSESLRTSGHRTLPRIANPVCNHVNEEAEIPLLSGNISTPRRGHTLDSRSSTGNWDVIGENQRSNPDDTFENSSSEKNGNVNLYDNFVINNLNNNNCKEGNKTTRSNGYVFAHGQSMHEDQNESRTSCLYDEDNDSTCYQGRGENRSGPLSDGVAKYDATKYRREMLKTRTLSSTSRRRSASSSMRSGGDISPKSVGYSKCAVSNNSESASLLNLERCVVHKNSKTDIRNPNDSQSISLPKTSSTWC